MMSTPILTTRHCGVRRFGDLQGEVILDTRCATAFGCQPLQMTPFIGALEGGQ